MEHGTFLGWIGDDVLHSLYRIADLCVVPSIYEPFGLVALEAMASGCPCIVADTGGLREVVPNRGGVGLRFRGARPERARRDARAAADRRRSCATAWSPRPPSTCCASTGATSPQRTRKVYRELIAPRPASGPSEAPPASRVRRARRSGCDMACSVSATGIAYRLIAPTPSRCIRALTVVSACSLYGDARPARPPHVRPA